MAALGTILGPTIWIQLFVLTAIIGAGFELEFLHEHEFTLYEQMPFLQRTARPVAGSRPERTEVRYVMPDELPRLPMMYSLRAIRSASATGTR